MAYEQSRLLKDLAAYFTLESGCSPIALTQRKKNSNAGRKPKKLSDEEKRIKAAWDSKQHKSTFEVDKTLSLDEGTTRLMLDRIRQRKKHRRKSNPSGGEN
jgi:hypothetical protein